MVERSTNWRRQVTVDVSSVEYDYEVGGYIAVFTDGDVAHLTARTLAEAEREARRLVDFYEHAEYDPRHEQI